MRERTRAVGAWILVMGVTAVALKALDRLPAWLTGATHGARVFLSLDDAGRAVGARIWLPAYYPEELAWPPSRIEASTGEPAVLVVGIAGRRDGRERLVIAQSIGGAAPPPPGFLPEARAIETAQVPVGAHRASLSRVLIGPRALHDLWWDQGGRRVTLRYDGPVETLLLIAASLERRAASERR